MLKIHGAVIIPYCCLLNLRSMVTSVVYWSSCDRSFIGCHRKRSAVSAVLLVGSSHDVIPGCLWGHHYHDHHHCHPIFGKLSSIMINHQQSSSVMINHQQSFLNVICCLQSSSIITHRVQSGTWTEATTAICWKLGEGWISSMERRIQSENHFQPLNCWSY